MEIANCSTKVSVYVPTKYSAKELVVKCGSMLSREYDIYCDRHDHQETMRCSRCGVNGFTSDDQLLDHYEIDCG
jgi:hypothetical protein|tara:strand:- start:882 stop:1103 length:222 start_codon:yes stop_codon:yes gene_type:complete